jgi:hypothetical protein
MTKGLEHASVTSYTEPLGSEERSKLRRVRVRRVRSDNAFWSRGTPKTDYAVQLGADATDASASGDRRGQAPLYAAIWRSKQARTLTMLLVRGGD